MCPWMLVVDYYLVYILSYFEFELLDVLGRFVTGWLSLETKTSCPDFDPSARAGIAPIQYFLCSVGRSSVVLAARAGLCECRSSGALVL